MCKNTNTETMKNDLKKICFSYLIYKGRNQQIRFNLNMLFSLIRIKASTETRKNRNTSQREVIFFLAFACTNKNHQIRKEQHFQCMEDKIIQQNNLVFMTYR